MSNFNFKKSLLAVATGAAMVAGAMSSANADSLLFPYVPVKSGTTCSHYVDYFGAITAHNLLQQTVAAPSQSGLDLQAIFGGTKGTPGYPSIPAADYANGLNGYLVVSTFDTAGAAYVPATPLYGDMIVVDPTQGTVMSYQGMSNQGAAEGDFSALAATHSNIFNLSWYPTDATTGTGGIAGTSWNVLQLNTAAATPMTMNGFAPATVTIQNADTLNGYVYNRNEATASGFSSTTVGCTGAFNLAPGGVLTGPQLTFAAGGGTLDVRADTNVGSTSATSLPANNLIMYKVQSTAALGASKAFLAREMDLTATVASGTLGTTAAPATVGAITTGPTFYHQP